MGYRIEYDPGNGKYEVKSDKSVKILLILAGFAGMLLLIHHFAPESAGILRGMLIPGEDAVTVQAFENMTDDLRSGAALGEALEGFCRYVIHGS
jgi:hypothetical protein